MKRGKLLSFVLVLVIFISQCTAVLAADSRQGIKSFPDISGHWAERIITAWTEKGFIAGLPDGTFAPHHNITRAQFVALVNRAFQPEVPAMGQTISFPDVNKENWFYNEVMLAAKAGYIKGFPDGRFGADELITRQDASVIISRFLAVQEQASLQELSVFSDAKTISDYALNSVAALKELKIISGYPDGTFGSQREISRAEAIAILDRVYKMVSGGTGITGRVYYDNKPLDKVTVIIQKENGYQTVKTAMTDGGGSFQAAELPVGTYDLVFSTKELSAYKAKICVREGFMTFVRITAEKGQTVTGTLQDNRGIPYAHKQIYFKTNPYFSTLTDNEGSFAISLPRNKQYALLYEKGGKLQNIVEFTTSSAAALSLGEIKIKFGERDNSIFSVGSIDATDEAVVDAAIAELKIGYAYADYAESVTRSLQLPVTGVNGTAISWTSNNTALIDSNGTVQRPKDGKSVKVSLTATVTKNTVSKKVTFELKVIKDSSKTVLKDHTLEDLLALNEGNIDEEILPFIIENDAAGIPEWINGRYTPLLVESPEEAIRSLCCVKTIMDIENPEKEFRWLRTDSPHYFPTYRLQQVYNGVPVYGAQLMVSTDNNGLTTSLNGTYIPDVHYAEVEVTPGLSREQAISAVKKHLGGNVEAYNEELIIYAVKDVSPRLAWLVSVSGTDPDGNPLDDNVFLDANKGGILEINHITPLAGVTTVKASGKGINGKEKHFTVEKFSDTVYLMYDAKRKIRIYTWDEKEKKLPGIVITSADNTWNNPSAVDAYVHLAITYDYYKNVLGRDSFNGEGMEINCSVNYRKDPEKAESNGYWNSNIGKGQISFGEEDFFHKEFSAGLDMVAHEFTHGVIQYIAGLKYRNQSGAINEAYADILGNLVENKNDNKWLIGEDCIKWYDPYNALRSMSNPENRNCAKKVGGKYYIIPVNNPNEFNDYGGVHTNSGIVSYVAYLMWKDTIKEKDKLAKIWYTSLKKLNTDSDYLACRLAVINTAKEFQQELGLTNEQIKGIGKCFDNAGVIIGLNDLDKNAWYYKCVDEAVKKGIISGYEDGSVRPEIVMTHAEFLAIVIKAFSYNTDFSEEALDSGYPTSWKNHWAFGVLKVAKDSGWIDVSLNPDAPITREEAGYYLWEAYLDASWSAISDLKLISYNKNENYGMLSPINKKNKQWNDEKAFLDQKGIDSKYEEAIYQLYMNDIYFGYDDQTFKPSQHVDRATCCLIITSALVERWNPTFVF